MSPAQRRRLAFILLAPTGAALHPAAITAERVEVTVDLKRGELTHEFPAHSFAVIRIKPQAQ